MTALKEINAFNSSGQFIENSLSINWVECQAIEVARGTKVIKQNYYQSLFQQMENKDLWMNQRKLDQKGLIVPYTKERQFNLKECIHSLQNLLAFRQSQDLKAHYSHYTVKEAVSPDFENIVYKGYLVSRCPLSKLGEEKTTQEGEMLFQYRIDRLDQSQVKCIFPYLLRFEVKIDFFLCPKCEQSHLYRIYKSNFEAIRTEFAMQVSSKIKFLDKYPTYTFQPFNFISTRAHGDTPFLRLKYQDYQSSQYFEVAQQIMANLLLMNGLKESMDFESIRFETYSKWMNLTQEQLQRFQSQFKVHDLRVKTKYICKRCKERVIWTTKNKVKLMYKMIKLNELPEMDNDKRIFDKDEEFIGMVEQYRKKLKEKKQRVDAKLMSNLFKLESEDKLDKSLIREVQQYEEFKKYWDHFGRWHASLEEYLWPFLVVVKVEIPKMTCTGCQLQKDGLIYVSNLVNFVNSSIAKQVIRKAKKYFGNKISKKKQQ